jgi:glutathione S-transferase
MTNKVSGRYKQKLTDPPPDSPFVQRVWIALEVKGLNYQYIEVDPYKKPQSLLEINPRGMVPALKHGEYATFRNQNRKYQC